jgi:hypothetical protein
MATALRDDARLLKPVIRAYALGYLMVTAPRLLGFLKTIRRKYITIDEKVKILRSILATATELNRFPTASAIIVGGSTALPVVVNRTFQRLLVKILANGRISRRRLDLLVRGLCVFVSAWLAFYLLNNHEDWSRQRVASLEANKPKETPDQQESPRPPSHFAGKTVDLTAFAFYRALDTLVVTAWARSRSRSWHLEKSAPRLARLARHLSNPTLFSASAAIIMYSWFYAPERLPRSYQQWISKVADIDSRLIEALRRAYRGEFTYGVSKDQTSLLAPLCRDLGLPEVYADPSRTTPIPCELYHCGTGPSCEYHALSRWARSFVLAMKIYLPLRLLPLLRLKKPFAQAMVRNLKSAARSSSFLATFTALIYYNICLARTRLGPLMLPKSTISPQRWDSGLAVLMGCLTCGWSILVEEPGRRSEIAMFVAPRALATLVPRLYEEKYQWREKVVFASSMAIVMTAVTSGNEQMVRGVFGKLLSGIVR